jgi:hypothetical protein
LRVIASIQHCDKIVGIYQLLFFAILLILLLTTLSISLRICFCCPVPLPHSSPPEISQFASTSLLVRWREPPAALRRGAAITAFSLERVVLPATLAPPASLSLETAAHSADAAAAAHHISSASDQCATPANVDVAIPAHLVWETVYTGPDTVRRVTGLRPNARYAFRVRCRSEAGVSAPGAHAVATTLRCPMRPPPAAVCML